MVKTHWDDEELIENWTLLPTELELVGNKVGANQIGFAILLKYFQAFARFPASSTEISDSVISYIAQQLQIPSSIYSEYNWQGRSISNHRASIRKLFGFRTATVIDGEEIVDWLKAEIIESEQRIEPITELVYQQFRSLQIEPPTEGRVERIIKSAIASPGQTHLIFIMLTGTRFQLLFSFVAKNRNLCRARLTGFRCVCPDSQP